MGINFGAIYMAGYNNPEIRMIPVTINLNSGAFIDPPSYADIQNICKSGAFPVLCVTDADRTFAYILPLSYYTSDVSDGLFSFCGTTHEDSIAPPAVLSVVYAKRAAAPVFQTYLLPDPVE